MPNTVEDIAPAQPSAAQGGDRFYWLTRRWAYGLLLPASERSPIPEPSAEPHDGSSDFDLTDADPEISDVLNQICFGTQGVIGFERGEGVIRPMARRLLKLACEGGGKPIPVAVVARHLWNRSRPPSHATLRTTLFRVNDALRRIDCPIQLSLHRGIVVFR